MKIKKAPVSDLIAYFIELYNKDITGTEHTSIPDIISSYYQKIAGSRIPIYEKILIFAVVKEIGDREGRLFLL